MFLSCPKVSRFKAAISAACMLLFVTVCGSAFGEEKVLGTPGISGPDGAEGGGSVLAQNGQDGTAGGDITANLTTSELNYSGIAAGGFGGDGGDGGRVVRPNGNAGDGGDGAKGGNSTVNFQSTGAGYITVTSQGGGGGSGGYGGYAADYGNGGNGGNGGDSGSASLVANIAASSETNVAGVIRALAGGGGNGGSAGLGFFSNPVPTNGQGGNGGTATASATISNALGDVWIEVEAYGGSGGETYGSDGLGNNGGHGGAASLGPVSAVSLAKEGSVRLQASIYGGPGGNASGDGVGGNGVSATLIDAIDGSANSNIHLIQAAYGGSGGSSTGGFGTAGDAFSSLSRTKAVTGPQGLTITTAAIAGTGRSANPESETTLVGAKAEAISNAVNTAGVASAHASSQASEHVYTTNGILEQQGGSATSRASAKGTAVLSSDAYSKGGQGGRKGVLQNSGAKGGDATSIARGDATISGSMTSSTAIGGNGGDSKTAFDSEGGSGGNGGDASSESTSGSTGKSKTATASASARAEGGDGGMAYRSGNNAGSGGVATAHASASAKISASAYIEQIGGNGGNANPGAAGGAGADSVADNAVSGSSRGTLYLKQTARAGNGGMSSGGPAGLAGNGISKLAPVNADGGSITAETESIGGNAGISSGDAADGGSATAEFNFSGENAIAGTARSLAGAGGNSANGEAGIGGTAISRSLVIQTGRKESSSHAISTGGTAGGILSTDALAGKGGYAEASSSVVALKSNSLASAVAEARGGSGGDTYNTLSSNASGGDALALSSSQGKRVSESYATATGGQPLNGAFGSASAQATAVGSKAKASSSASSGHATFLATVKSEASGSGTFVTEAHATSGTPAPEPLGPHQGSAFAIANPSADAAASMLAGNQNALAVDGDTVLIGSVDFGKSETDRRGKVTFSSTVALGVGTTGTEERSATLSLLNPTFSGDGFKSLSFQLIAGTTVIESQSFRSLSAALEYFDDHVFNLTAGPLPAISLSMFQFVITATTTARGDRFGLDFAFNDVANASTLNTSAVPEPSTLALALISVLLAGAILRSRRKAISA